MQNGRFSVMAAPISRQDRVGGRFFFTFIVDSADQAINYVVYTGVPYGAFLSVTGYFDLFNR